MGDGTMLRYILSPGQVKEEIVLEEYNGFMSYSMLMDASGLAGELQENNEVFLLDESGEVIVSISAPYMYDEVGESSSAFKVTIAEDDNKLVVTYTPDSGWLNDDERVWPVVIDPTVDSKSISNANQIDNYIWNGGAGGVADTILWAGNRLVGGARKAHHIYWRLGVLPSLGSNYTITGASFNIRVNDADSTMGSNGLSLYKANATWTSGGITWANQPGATKIDSCGNSMPANPKWKSFSSANVITTVRGWYSNTSTNHGFSLRYTSVNDADANRFYSADNGVSYIPFLTVTYNTSAPPPILVTSVTVSPTSASLAVGATQTLAATVSPSNAANKTLTWTTSNSSIATVSNGVVTAIGVGTATIKATASDGSGKFGQCTVTVNPLLLYQSRFTEVKWFTSNSSTTEVIRPDLFFNDMSQSSITSSTACDNTDFGAWQYDYHAGSLTYYTFDISYRKELFLGTATNYFTNNTFKPIITDMIDHFLLAKSNNFFGTIEGYHVYKNSTLTSQVQAHTQSITYVNNIKSALNSCLKQNSGSLIALKYDPAKRFNYTLWQQQAFVAKLVSMGVKPPVFSSSSDTITGFTICIDSLHGNKIEILSYSRSGISYSGSMRVTYYDHFGLDVNDLANGYPGSFKNFAVNRNSLLSIQPTRNTRDTRPFTKARKL